MPSTAPRPHGGRLVSRRWTSGTAGMHAVDVPAELADEAENIADGTFSPLEGFLGPGDLESVARRGRLESGLAWTMPTVLAAGAAEARAMADAGEVLLRGPGGSEAVLRAEGSSAYDRAAAARGVFGTDDPAHPGAAKVLSAGERIVHGRVDLVRGPEGSPLRSRRMPPERTREAFSAAGWDTVVAFQTRNPPHVAHEMLQKAALASRDGVFVSPIVGRKKPGDFVDEVIVGCYDAMIRSYYPEGRCMLATLHTEMRYAGPREAVHHAIVRQNYGCSHIIIGRDHAGVGSYYDPLAAHRAFGDYPDLGIEPVFFPALFYCRRCLSFTAARACPHGEGDREQVSGTRMREMIQAGERPSEFVLRPEVADVILAHPAPFVGQAPRKC